MSEEELKISVIKEIKKYPNIWNLRNRGKGRDLAWKEIQTKFGLPLQQLKMYWDRARTQYFNILKHKTVKREVTPSRWYLFHEMSFMYDIVKESIAEKTRGMIPPFLLIPPSVDGVPREPCPCCITLPSDAGTNMEKLPGGDPLRSGKPTSSGETSKEVEKPSQANRSTNHLKRPLDTSNQRPVPVKEKRKRAPILKGEPLTIERQKIITAIKQYPVLYAHGAPSSKFAHSRTWKIVAREVGITPQTIQVRWKLIKSRYAEELIRELNSNDGRYRSNWRFYEQMSFMRDHVQRDIDNIQGLRQKMDQVLDEQRRLQTFDFCQDEDNFHDMTGGGSQEATTNNSANMLEDPIDLGQSDADQVSRDQDQVSRDQDQVSRDQDQISRDQDQELPVVIELNLSSDEEDSEADFRYLDDGSIGSMATDSSIEIYEEGIAFSAEQPIDDIICLDD